MPLTLYSMMEVAKACSTTYASLRAQIEKTHRFHPAIDLGSNRYFTEEQVREIKLWYATRPKKSPHRKKEQ